MKSRERFLASQDTCPYLPEQIWQLEYDLVTELNKEEYSALVRKGWRKFGSELFRPQCPACSACQSIRILVDEFRPSRAQRRAIRANQDLRLEISVGTLTPEKLSLYWQYHQSRAEAIGWKLPSVDSALMHLAMLCEGPLKAQEWCFYLDTTLVAFSYVDPLDDGLSAIYSVYSPDYKERSLGSFIILSLIERAAREHLPYVYLGYYVAGCRSMSYKASYRPNQVLGPDLEFHDFSS